MAHAHHHAPGDDVDVVGNLIGLVIINYPIHVALLTLEFSIWQSVVIAIPTTIAATILVFPALFIALFGITIGTIFGISYVSYWFIDVVTTVIP